MAKLDLRNIGKAKGRCGGRAVVAGTRLRMSVLVGWYRAGRPVDEIVAMYPGLRPSDVHDALAYADDHPDEIARDQADDDEAAAEARWPGGAPR